MSIPKLFWKEEIAIMPRYFNTHSVIITFLLLIIQNASAHGTSKPPALTPEQREQLSAASSDVYFPPENDRLTEAQILAFIRTVEKAKQINRTKDDYHHGMAHSACDRTSFRIAQVEAVKSTGGNWAEFDWVHRHLMQMVSVEKITRVSHDPVMEHNLKLLRRHHDEVLAALTHC